MAHSVPYLSTWYYVPLDRLASTEVHRVKQHLTYQPRARMGTRDLPPPICHYDESVEGYLGIPPDWGLRNYPQNDTEDMTTPGTPGLQLVAQRRPDPHHPSAGDNQSEFMADLYRETTNNVTCLGIAPTGTGKTVCAVDVAAQIALPVLVLVHLVRIAEQWKQEFIDKLGIPEDQIGWVRGKTCNYDRPVMVGTVQSVISREYPEEFYKSRGLVIWDEVHKMGAPAFSASLHLFPAMYRLALTATAERKDGCQGVFQTYFGTGQAQADADAMPLHVYPLMYQATSPVYGKSHSSWMMSLAHDTRRNLMLVRQIKQMYEDGRQLLVVGDNIEHLETLIAGCVAVGVPADDIGQYTGERTVKGHTSPIYGPVETDKVEVGDELVFWGYRKDTPKTDRVFKRYQMLRVEELIEQDGTDYLVLAHHYDERVREVVTAEVFTSECKLITGHAPKRRKVTKEELDAIEAGSRIIVATYGMIKEGIDIPRLDAGIDVTPRSDAIQVIGRVRRRVPGKRLPVWVTVVDRISNPLMRYWQSRLREYQADRAVEVVYSGN